MSKWLFGGICLLHLLILNIITFTAWPEMLSYPYLFLKGFALYKDFILPYPPGLVLVLAGVYGIFGISIETLKLFSWSLIILNDLVIFLIIKKFTKSIYHLGFLMFVYILLQSFLDGNMLWFDFATTLPLLTGLFFVLKWLESEQSLSFGKRKGIFWLLAIISLSIAVLIKQVALIYLFLLAVYYLFFVKTKKALEIMILIFIPLILSVLLFLFLFINKSINEFWMWTINYPLLEWSKFPGYVNYLISRREILVSLLLVTPLVFGLIKFKNNLLQPKFFLTVLLFIGAIIAIYPRFSYFHLQPALGLLVILFAQIMLVLKGYSKLAFVLVLSLATILIIFLTFSANTTKIRFFDLNEQKISMMINSAVNNQDRVFLLGLNSSQYAFTNTLPPTHWSDNFGWYLEIPGVQEWVIQGFEITPPEYIFRKIPRKGNWYEIATYQPNKIMQYLVSNYEKVDKIEDGIEIWKIKKQI